jgi:hypothetical protein
MAEIINFSETARSTDNALADLQALFADDLLGVESGISKHMQSAADLIPAISEHLIGAGGKRLRPLLTLSAARLSGYEGHHHITMAAAVEYCTRPLCCMMMWLTIVICDAANRRRASYGEIRPAYWLATFCSAKPFA